MYKAPKRKSYSLLFKLKVANDVLEKRKQIQTTAFKFNVANKSVRDWVRKIDEIKEQLKKRNNRLSFRIRKRNGVLNDIESRLFIWIKEKRMEGACLNSKAIKLKARELHNEIDINTEFQMTNGWFEKFLKRYGLSCRRVSSSGRDLPKNCHETIKVFLKDCEKFNHLDTKAFYNMDEASIYLDSASNI